VQELFDPPRFRFSHMLVRETIYRDLGAAERERLHAGVALALESLGASERLAELSHHLALAGGSADPSRTLAYCRQAGERALHTYAHEEAAVHFQRALAAVRGDADHQRVGLLLSLADAHQRCGDRAQARAACEQAADVARRLGDPRLLASAALRLGAEFTFGHVDPMLVGMLEDSLRGLGDAEPALRARLMARLAAARQPAPDPDGPIALATEAVALARTVGDRPVLALVLRDARAAYMPFDDLDDRLALDLEALALAYETGDKMTLGQSLWRLAVERMEQGNFAAARGHLDQLERLTDEVRQPHRRWWWMMARAGLASFLGNFAEADRLFDESEPVAAGHQDPNARVFQVLCRFSHAWTATRRDEQVELQTRLTEALRVRGHMADSPLMIATLNARMSEGEELAGIADQLFAQWPRRFSGQHFLAEIAARAGNRDAAAAFYDHLLPWESRIATPYTPEGSYAHYLGLLATCLGRRADAARHFEAAIAIHERIGARPWVAHSQMAYADLLESGGERDRRLAEELRARARTIAEELGMTGMLERFGVVAAPAPPRVHAEPLAVQQGGEYWTVKFEGAEYRFKDSKGMQIVAHLVRNPGREFHVLHLAGLASGSEGEALVEPAAAAAADPAARTAYRERAEALQDELREAEVNGDLGRAARARAELDALAEELARGVGLGGRERRTGGSAERARINIQRRISDALRKIEEACPPLGRRLSRAIRTGAYCLYEEG
jgi:tetratricopeptide (TPR) repeat protein